MGPEAGGPKESESTFSGVKAIIGEVMELDDGRLRTLNRGTALGEDLDADSLALIETIEAAEAKFGVRLADDTRLAEIKNLGDVVDWIDELRGNGQ